MFQVGLDFGQPLQSSGDTGFIGLCGSFLFGENAFQERLCKLRPLRRAIDAGECGEGREHIFVVRCQGFFADRQDAQNDRLGGIEVRLGQMDLGQTVECDRVFQARLAGSSLGLRHITLGEHEGVGIFSGDLEFADLIC